MISGDETGRWGNGKVGENRKLIDGGTRVGILEGSDGADLKGSAKRAPILLLVSVCVDFHTHFHPQTSQKKNR